jgi:hypothetical protein
MRAASSLCRQNANKGFHFAKIGEGGLTKTGH